MKTLINSALITFFIGATVSTPVVHAQAIGGETNAEFSAVPPESQRSDPPEVMLSLSRDHQYFFKAYNDYTDLDPPTLDDQGNLVGDVVDGLPVIETTYKHSFDYFGYFDAFKCYEYSGNRYVPQSITADKYCSGSEWSGNFLNWIAMTRMDVVRAIFYGGQRVVDDVDETVLRRAYLPMDAHSYAKYYNGNDIALLTPFNNVKVNGDQGDLDTDLDNIDEGITFCNTTPGADTNTASQDSTEAPLIRVAIGNYQLWGANERWQCTWNDEGLASSLRDGPNNTRVGNSSNTNVGPSNPIDSVIVDPATGLRNFPLEFDGLNSGIDAHDTDPAETPNSEFIVDVEVCVDGLIGRERCKTYPTGQVKPIGLLQIYGDDGLINFGLLTGSYETNTEGGVLRKNTGPLDDEVAVASTGQFIFTDQSDSIIKFLSRIRPFGYTYSNGTYRNRAQAGDFCDFQLTDIDPSGDGQCYSWGNPISEIFKETMRYMAGLQPTPEFASNDDTFIDGLTDADWVDPLDEDNQCADLNTIVINASVSSYDNDNTAIADLVGGLDGAAANASGTTTEDWTEDVGDDEGINGNQFFIGLVGGAGDEFCTAKTVGSLADATGICPEAPTVEGSFDMAGIAYYAHNNDIRPDLDGNQTVNTFAISLATNTPIIRVPRVDSASTPVDILPAYRLITNNGEGGGALVDFKIVRPHSRIGTTEQYSASFYVNWEDSEQGGDYDQDVWGLIDYVLDETANTIEVTTTVFGESTSTDQLFGFVINGTTQDSFHAYSGIEDVTFPGNLGVPGCENCAALFSGRADNPVDATTGPDGTGDPRQQGPQSHKFSIAPSTTGTLESPLYYAAKYGGFNENLAADESITVDDTPDELDEWDAVNNTTGAMGPDGLPDNFFFVINPENLFDSLENSLNQILLQERAASSAVASFANSNGFGNIVIQGTYQELTRDDGAQGQIREVEWSGEIFSSFIDTLGNFREDNRTSGTRGELDGSDRIYRYDLTGDVPIIVFEDGSTADVSDLNTLWSGGDRLRSINNDDTILQRPYNTLIPTAANTGGASRHIITYFDEDGDGVVDPGEQTDFVDTNIDNTNFGFFGVGSVANAQAIVNFTRGFDDSENTGFRNRTLIENGEEVVYRLGDLVNSTPLIVGGPLEEYNTRFDDESYQAFVDRYGNDQRRQVAYVGANDGMLHAFNAGFTNLETIAVEYTETSKTGQGTPQPLGTELWAYAPFNLLPHLQWLTSGFYNHVFYVDGDPQAFDVKIFNDDATHPGGWGTILVVNMRQGGGDFEVRANNADRTLRSAYIVLDITDPESPPEVLAEITHENLNLTTSVPDIFYDCGGLCASDDTRFDGEWKLVFGSGPTDIRNLTTTEDARIFTYDLESGAIEEELVTTGVGNIPVPNSHVGDVAAIDWDGGTRGVRNDDAVYFGTVGRELDPTGAAGNLDNQTGSLYRFFPSDNNTTNLMFDTDRPVVEKPITLSRESLGNGVLGSWVFAGTGQYLKRADGDTSEQERYYGLLEPIDSAQSDAVAAAPIDPDREDSELLTYATITENDLLDVTNVQVRVDTGELVAEVNFPGLADGANDLDSLASGIIGSTNGWFRNLPLGVPAGSPSLRVIDGTAVLLNQIFFTGFTPESEERLDICVGGEGTSTLFVLNQTTGTASRFGALGTTTPNGDIAETSVTLGEGISSAPIIFNSEELGANRGVVVIQRPDGSLVTGRTRCDGTVTFDPDEVIPDDCDDGSGGTTPREFGFSIDGIEQVRSGWRELFQ